MDNLGRNLLISPFIGAAFGAALGAILFGTAMMAPAIFFCALMAPLVYIVYDMVADSRRRAELRRTYRPSPRRPKYVDWDYGRKDKKDE